MTSNSINDWFTKVISPGTLLSIIFTASICYGTVQVVSNQQVNDGKRIEQVEKAVNAYRISIDQIRENATRTQVTLENLGRQVQNISEDNREFITELKKSTCEIATLSKTIAVLVDRENRNDPIKTNCGG